MTVHGVGSDTTTTVQGVSVAPRLKHALRPENRKRIIGPWVLVNVVYDIVRCLVMVSAFDEYGLNGWIYAGFVLIFSVIYAWATLELVGAFVDGNRPRANWLLPVVVASFIAPDLYVVVVTRDVPTWIFAVLGGYLTISTAVTVKGLVGRYRAKRAAADVAAQASSDGAFAASESTTQ